MSLMSLGQFERTYGVNKGSVFRAAKKLGIATSSGLKNEDVIRLIRFLKVRLASESSLKTADSSSDAGFQAELRTIRETEYRKELQRQFAALQGRRDARRYIKQQISKGNKLID